MLSWANGGYSTKQLLRICYEDIFNSPKLVADQIAGFMEVETQVVLDSIAFVSNSASSSNQASAGQDDSKKGAIDDTPAF